MPSVCGTIFLPLSASITRVFSSSVINFNQILSVFSFGEISKVAMIPSAIGLSETAEKEKTPKLLSAIPPVTTKPLPAVRLEGEIETSSAS